MKKILLKVFGMYRKPDAEKKEDAKVKPVKVSVVPEEYHSHSRSNDLNKINCNYVVF
jgi:hypothetical protein